MTEPDAGFGALFDFNFDRYVTIRIVRLAYKLAFGIALLNALAGLVLTFTVVADMFRWTSYGGFMQILSLAFVFVMFFGSLLVVRLWLEALVVHFKGHEGALKATDLAGMKASPHAVPQTSASATSQWSCACGGVNNGTKFCGECGSPRPESGS